MFSELPYDSLDGNIVRKMSRLPNHADVCEVRRELFSAAKQAQKRTVLFLRSAVGVDTGNLVKKFEVWEKDETPPSQTSQEVMKYFGQIVRSGAKNGEADNPEERGPVATRTGVTSSAEYSSTIALFNLFRKTLEAGCTVQDASGNIYPGIDRKLPKGFLDDFIKNMVGKNSEEEKKFRAFLAGHLFDELHSTLIQLPNPLVRELDTWKNHEYFPDGLQPKDAQAALSEMVGILMHLPFSPSTPLKAQSRRLQRSNLSPRFLQYFSALGWDEELKMKVTIKYAQRLRMLSQSIFAELS